MSSSGVYSIRLRYNLLLAIILDLEEKQIEYTSISGAVLQFLISNLPDIEIDPQEALAIISEKVKLSGKNINERKKREFQSKSPASNLTNLHPLLTTGYRRLNSEETHRAFAMPGTLDSDFAPSMNSNFEMNLEPAEETKNLGFGLAEVLEAGLANLDQNAEDDLEDVIAQAIKEIEKEDSTKLLNKITGGFSIANAKDLPKPASKMNAISEKDPRLQKDKLWKIFSGEADEAKMFALRILYYNLPEEHWSTEKAENMLIQLLENLS